MHTIVPPAHRRHTALFAVLRGNDVYGGDVNSPAIVPFIATLAPSAAWAAVKRAPPPAFLVAGPVSAATLHIYDRWWVKALPAGAVPTTGLRRRTL